MQTRGSLDARQMAVSSLFWKFVHFEVGGMFSKKKKKKNKEKSASLFQTSLDF